MSSTTHRTMRRRRYNSGSNNSDAGVDASYSSTTSENFATQSAPLSIANLRTLRDKFDELVDRLKEESQTRRRLEAQLTDEQCFRDELVQAQVTAKAGDHANARAKQLATLVANLRLKLRQANDKVAQLQFAANVAAASGNNGQNGRGRGRNNNNNNTAAAAAARDLAFHNQKLKTEVAELEAQLKMSKIVAKDKVQVAQRTQQQVKVLQERLDECTLDNDRLLEKSKSLLGKYRRTLTQMRGLKNKLGEAERRAKQAGSRSEGLEQRMTGLRRRNQSLSRSVEEAKLELKQARFAHDHNEQKHQEVVLVRVLFLYIASVVVVVELWGGGGGGGGGRGGR